MDTLDFIAKRFSIDLGRDEFIVPLGYSRWGEMPHLFKDLKFAKGAIVGVDRGRFAAALSAGNSNLLLIGVDEWIGDEGEGALAQAKEKTAGRRTVFINAREADALKRFPDDSLDFVYLEKSHEYEDVVLQIAAWSKKVRKGGLVSGHGYVKTERYDFGVIDAVDGWCHSHRVKPLFIWRDRCPSWMYVKI
ncbi:MAG: class I SAM-dependent methyltransferase [Candidatus Paceibacterota bacterium]|jgi:hypothetical protein|nr:class I SAM-dependent methyltransferase [Candidatus Paceibacterota bacterium]